MFKKILQFVFIALFFTQIRAQTTVTFTPSGDAFVLSETSPNNDAGVNYGSDPRLIASRWTNASIPYSTRSYIEFNTSSIPTSASVCSAILTFHTSSDDNPSGFTQSNGSYLKKVTSAWSPTVITWNNQPRTYSESDKISFGPISSSVTTGSSYTIDVTSHVQGMINSPSTNYGWVFMLQDTIDTYGSIGFSSNDYTVTANRPVLTVTYVSSLTVTPTATTVCSGTSATLTVSGASSYSWTPSTGLSTTTGTNVVATPTTTTAYTVTGTTGSCSTKAVSTVSVNPIPTLTISPTSSKVCAGTTTTITATGASTYSWTPSSGLSATTGTVVTATPTASTTYTITGTGSNGCTNKATSSITLFSNPTITVTSATICLGDSATLTATASGGIVIWSPTTAINPTSGSPIKASPPATTTYTATAIVFGLGGNPSCSSSATGTVTVNTPTLSINTPTVAICKGSSTALTVTGNGTTYSWTPSSGLSATTGTAVTASPTVTTNYTITATKGSCTAKATSSVTVNATPTLTVNSPTIAICKGYSTGLTVTGSGSTYSWTPSSGLSATTGTAVTASPTVTTNYTITATLGSCTATATSSVTVNATPTLTVNSPTIAICKGYSTGLTVTGSGSTYSWTPSSGLSATTGTAVTASPTVTTNYTITATLGSCTATATSSVTVNATPTLTVNSPTIAICKGYSTGLTVTGNGSTYSWTPSSGLSATTGTAVTASSTVTTNYTITATLGSCTATATSSVTVNATPTLTVNSPTIAICKGYSTGLTVTGSGSTYSWTPSSGLSATTGTAVTASPTVTTNYTITATLGSCTATATSSVTVNATPTLTVNSQTICIRSSVTLTVTGNGTTYSWAPSAGLSSTTGASVTATPSATTIYTVVATLGTCTAAATSTVNVNSPPVSVNSASILIGQSAVLTATGASSYNWSPSTGLSATTGATVTATPSVTTVYTVTGYSIECSNHATSTVTVIPDDVPEVSEPPCYCVSSFAPLPGKKYLVSAWAREDGASLAKTSFTYPAIYIDFTTSSNSYISTAGPFYPSGAIIDGWQRIEGTFAVPNTAYFMVLRLSSSSGDVLFDDIRAFPFDGSLKSYVYDPITMRLVAELDERNYATIYEYDEEGKLNHVKKETERGIMTIKESRKSPPKK